MEISSISGSMFEKSKASEPGDIRSQNRGLADLGILGGQGSQIYTQCKSYDNKTLISYFLKLEERVYFFEHAVCLYRIINQKVKKN